MNYKGIIFDLDGVICSTDKYHYQAWKQLADELGIYFDESINDRLRGVSRMKSLEIILEQSERKYTNVEKRIFFEKKNEEYKKLLQAMTPDDVKPEVKQTLDVLRQQGILLAIGSSSKNAGYILDRIGLKDSFDQISDGNNISRSKPDPEVFLKAAEYLGLPPETCLVVEDAIAGIEAAKSGGFDSAAIGGAAGTGMATYNLKNFSDILKIEGRKQ